MTRESPARVLGWKNCLNSRDLGGYPTKEGGVTRWGAVVRCDNPAQLTEEGRASALEYGIKTVIDLRNPEEVETHPNPFAENLNGLEYVNISVVDPAAEPPVGFTTLVDQYTRTLEDFPVQHAQVLKTVADARPGGILINCMGGKDRTGLVSALLLTLAGVPPEAVAADYAMSQELLMPQELDWLENGPGERIEREQHVEMFAARDEVMLEVLEYLDRGYGGVERYVCEAGVTAPVVEAIRRRLIDS